MIVALLRQLVLFLFDNRMSVRSDWTASNWPGEGRRLGNSVEHVHREIGGLSWTKEILFRADHPDQHHQGVSEWELPLRVVKALSHDETDDMETRIELLTIRVGGVKSDLLNEFIISG